MTTPEQQRKATALITRALERNGLTAFDLLSWIGLLALQGEVTGKSIGLFEGEELRSEIRKAARRKARLLDAETGTNFHSAVLKGFGIDPDGGT